MQALVIHAAGDLRIETIEHVDMALGQVRVRVRNGGICGSDLHYYQHGGFGVVRVKQPMVLGHEVSGVVSAVADDVQGLQVGDRIAINPSHPCGACRFCQLGLQNHCLEMRYLGSAMRMPHVQGAFRQEIVVNAAQGFKLEAHVSDAEGAMAEPLAVALHAVNRAGPLLGKRVLITGCGPIGAMMVIAARRAGAAEIVITDLIDQPLRKALKIGADQALNVASNSDALSPFAKDKGYFDVLLEASGSQQAQRAAFDVMRPRAVLVLAGLSGGEATLPLNTVVGKEFDVRGTFRFHEEFGVAVELLNKRLVDIKSLVSATLPFRDAGKAFALAADRSQAMKVILDFE